MAELTVRDYSQTSAPDGLASDLTPKLKWTCRICSCLGQLYILSFPTADSSSVVSSGPRIRLTARLVCDTGQITSFLQSNLSPTKRPTRPGPGLCLSAHLPPSVPHPCSCHCSHTGTSGSSLLSLAENPCTPCSPRLPTACCFTLQVLAQMSPLGGLP